jgi:hypothetical protein
MLKVVGNPELRDARWHKEDGTPAEGNHAIFPMNTATRVFAVNSTGYDGVQQSYVSAIQSIGGLQLNEVLLPGENTPRPVTTNELIDRGLIVVE